MVEAGVNLELVCFNWSTHWVGAGAGGANLHSSKEFVAGGYTGGGIGFRWNWLDLFARGRVELSQGIGLPTLLGPTLTGGVEARANRYVVASLGGGPACTWNGARSFTCFGLLQPSVSLLFELAPTAPPSGFENTAHCILASARVRGTFTSCPRFRRAT